MSDMFMLDVQDSAVVVVDSGSTRIEVAAKHRHGNCFYTKECAEYVASLVGVSGPAVFGLTDVLRLKPALGGDYNPCDRFVETRNLFKGWQESLEKAQHQVKLAEQRADKANACGDYLRRDVALAHVAEHKRAVEKARFHGELHTQALADIAACAKYPPMLTNYYVTLVFCSVKKSTLKMLVLEGASGQKVWVHSCLLSLPQKPVHWLRAHSFPNNRHADSANQRKMDITELAKVLPVLGYTAECEAQQQHRPL